MSKEAKDSSGIWYDVMKVTAATQIVFLERVFFIHSITKAKAGRSQTLKLALNLWNSEIDVTCLACYVFEKMRSHRTPENNLTFTEEVVKTLVHRYIEGCLERTVFHLAFEICLSCRLRDFHEELKGVLEAFDPGFKPEHLTIWQEHLPQAIKGDDTAQLVAADKRLEEMNVNQAKLKYEQDSLSLARDASQLARLRQEVEKTERSARLAKVQHLRAENAIGSGIIADFMYKRCHHVSGPLLDMTQEIVKAGRKSIMQPPTSCCT